MAHHLHKIHIYIYQNTPFLSKYTILNHHDIDKTNYNIVKFSSCTFIFIIHNSFSSQYIEFNVGLDRRDIYPVKKQVSKIVDFLV